VSAEHGLGYRLIRGERYPAFMKSSAIEMMRSAFVPRPTDIFVSTW
jgi:hypothetical protein